MLGLSDGHIKCDGNYLLLVTKYFVCVLGYDAVFVVCVYRHGVLSSGPN